MKLAQSRALSACAESSAGGLAANLRSRGKLQRVQVPCARLIFYCSFHTTAIGAAFVVASLRSGLEGGSPPLRRSLESPRSVGIRRRREERRAAGEVKTANGGGVLRGKSIEPRWTTAVQLGYVHVVARPSPPSPLHAVERVSVAGEEGGEWGGEQARARVDEGGGGKGVLADGGCQLARIPALARARTRPSPGAVPRRARAENSRRALALKARAAPRFTRERARLATGETRGLLYDNGQGDNGVSDVPGLPTGRPGAFPGGFAVTDALLVLPEDVRRRPRVPPATAPRAIPRRNLSPVPFSLSLFLLPFLSALRTGCVHECVRLCVCVCAPRLLAGILVARVHRVAPQARIRRCGRRRVGTLPLPRAATQRRIPRSALYSVSPSPPPLRLDRRPD